MVVNENDTDISDDDVIVTIRMPRKMYNALALTAKGLGTFVSSIIKMCVIEKLHDTLIQFGASVMPKLPRKDWSKHDDGKHD